MTNKAYIIAVYSQEYILLKERYDYGYHWLLNNDTTEWYPAKSGDMELPYVIYLDDISKQIRYDSLEDLDTTVPVVYDGRKEEGVMNKVDIPERVYKSLKEWRDNNGLGVDNEPFFGYMDNNALGNFPDIVKDWWVAGNTEYANFRLIAVLHWLNGQEPFNIIKEPKVITTPKYAVFNTSVTDDYGNATLMNTGNDLDKIKKVYFGDSYVIKEIK